jgi:hypothetical protein
MARTCGMCHRHRVRWPYWACDACLGKLHRRLWAPRKRKRGKKGAGR